MRERICCHQRENTEKVIFQQIDLDGFLAYCNKNQYDNKEATRSAYAVHKYGMENLEK
jgi:hypothetical protein